jgi:hypothetical protein
MAPLKTLRFTLSCLVTCLVMGVTAQGQVLPQSKEIPVEFRCPIPKRGYIEYLMPPAWHAEVKQPPEDLPPTMVITPKEGKEFQVLITVGWAPLTVPSFDKPGTLYELAGKQRDEIATKAVEKEIIIKELTGSYGTGYYVSATDKKPGKGEYICITQGTMPVKDLLLVFTIFTDSLSTGSIDTCLSMMAKATRYEMMEDKLSNKVPEIVSKALAESWLMLMDALKYAECWEQSSVVFKKQLAKEEALIGYRAMREPLGKVIKRDYLDSKYVKTLVGQPECEGVIVRYKTAYEKRSDVIEVVGTIHDKDNNWRVVGYITN